MNHVVHITGHKGKGGTGGAEVPSLSWDSLPLSLLPHLWALLSLVLFLPRQSPGGSEEKRVQFLLVLAQAPGLTVGVPAPSCTLTSRRAIEIAVPIIFALKEVIEWIPKEKRATLTVKGAKLDRQAHNRKNTGAFLSQHPPFPRSACESHLTRTGSVFLKRKDS